VPIETYSLTFYSGIIVTSKKLRVLHIHDVAFVATNLVSGLCEMGVDARLYTLLKKNTKLPKVLQLIFTTLLRFCEIFRLAQYLRREKFDIIHVHFGSFAYLAFLNRVPFFLHVHGTDVRTFIHWPILGKIIRHGVKRARAVFYTTPDLKSLVEKVRPDAIFFPNPIDTAMFNASVETATKTQPVIFNINKIDRYKGTKQVLRAIELVWRKSPNIMIKMFSFGNAIEEANEFLSKHKNDPRLILIPRIPHDDMPHHIQTSSIILGQIGTGILTCSELEAMACSKSVICNFSYSHMYSVPPPVLIVNSPEEASEQLHFLIENPQMAQKTGEEAREWVVKYFDKRLIAEKLVKIYQEKSEKSNISDVAFA